MRFWLHIKKFLGRMDDYHVFEKLSAYSLLAHEFNYLANCNEFPSREGLWEHAVRLIGEDKEVLFLEFGVYQGYSIDYFGKLLKNPRSKLIGFDSFRGLPEKWGEMNLGTFSTQGKPPSVKDPRIGFVIGLFQDTVPAFMFSSLTESSNYVPLFHFDADLYSSTLFCLFNVANKFRSFRCIFDEFAGDECRALHNFCQATNFKCEFEGVKKKGGNMPSAVLCRLSAE